ncbi:unannotated protein [freshwater metagenome]|uniref:Unannotated protein n=1 Tax=freshwater metagenome TaxID=449393 RepID=A0A6J6V5S8_9ZZZZ
MHVLGAVAPDVVDAHVEHVGAFPHLFDGDLGARVDVAGQHRVTERLRAVGVRALSDDEERVFLSDRDGGVDGRHARLELRVALRRGDVAHGIHDCLQVRGGGAAAAAHHADTELGNVAQVVLGESLGREVVVGPAVNHRREPGVGHHTDRHRAVLRQVAHVLLHLARAGGAVDAEHVRLHRREGCDGSADLGADEHATRRLDGDLDLYGDRSTGKCHRAPAADHGGLHLQQVHRGLDQEQVHTAVEERAGLFRVRIAQHGEGDVTEAGQFGARADRAGDISRPAVAGLPLVGDVAGDTRRRAAHLVGLIGDVVLLEHEGERPEGCCLDSVHTDLVEGVVHAGDHVRSREGEHLVAALEARTPEVVGREVESLHVRAEGAVKHNNPLTDCIEVGLFAHS